jgi:PAS domain S-box-containing protein
MWYSFKQDLERMSAPELLRVLVASGVIAERERAEDLVRMLASTVDQSAASVVITDAAGIIIYVNPRFTQLTGFAAEEVVGQSPRLLRTDETPAKTYKELWRTINKGQDWHGELRNRRKDDVPYWGSVLISPFRNSAGRV